MSRKYFINTIPQEDSLTLCDDEFHHIINVMRTKVGDEIIFTDGNGNNIVSTLIEIKENKAKFDILKRFFSSDTDFELLVCVGLMKGDKNEFVIQKCAELGATKLLFFESEFCVAKAKDNKQERYNKISLEASKQCGRSTIMEVLPTIKFNKLGEYLKDYEKVFCAYEKSDNTQSIQIESCNKIAIVIGSEGGFSSKEIEQFKQNRNVEIVSLGKRILRAETAVLAFTTIVMHKKGEI